MQRREEGIVLKLGSSKYLCGERDECWLKVSLCESVSGLCLQCHTHVLIR